MADEMPDFEEGYHYGGAMLGADVGGGIDGPPGSENWLWRISYVPVEYKLRDPQQDDEQFAIIDPQVIP